MDSTPPPSPKTMTPSVVVNPVTFIDLSWKDSVVGEVGPGTTLNTWGRGGGSGEGEDIILIRSPSLEEMDPRRVKSSL